MIEIKLYRVIRDGYHAQIGEYYMWESEGHYVTARLKYGIYSEHKKFESMREAIDHIRIKHLEKGE